MSERKSDKAGGVGSLALVIPAYNEEQRLAATLPEIRAYLESLCLPYEIIVVDDGSTDGTRRVVEALAGGDARVKVISLAANSGKGRAVQTGMLAASSDYVIFTDADLSTPIDTAGVFLKRLAGGSDIVIGNRRMRESRLEARQPWWRELLGRVFTRLTRLILRSPVTDQTCGFKGFTREAARQVFTRQTIPGWAFDAEILHIARRLGYSIRQEPVVWRNDAKSKVSVPAACVRSLGGLITIWWNGLLGRYN